MSNLDNILREMEAEAVASSRTIRLSLSQLLLAWAVIAGLMVMVFLFGFFSGRDQGLKIALDQQAEQAVRLPVVNAAVLTQTAPPPTSNADALAAPAPKQALPAPTAKGDFDFSASTVAPAPTPSATAAVPPSTAAVPKTDSAEALASTAPAQLAAGYAAKGAMEAYGPGDAPAAKLSEKEAQKPKAAEQDLLPAAKPKTIGQAEQGHAILLKVAPEPAAPVKQVAKPAEKLIEKAEREKIKPALKETVNETPKRTPEAPRLVTSASTVSTAGTAKTEPMRAETIKPASNLPVAAAVASGWYVQVAATTKKADSDSLVSQLHAGGVPVKVQQAQVGSAIYFRLLSGPYTSREDAQGVQRRIRGMKLGSGEPFLKKVN